MSLAVPRHNVNLTAEELRLIGRTLLGTAEVADGRERFEAAARRYFGVPHAIGVESGRTALHLALHGLGLKPRSRIVLPRYCFFSLVHVVQGMGMTPVFAPVDAHTFALDPDRLVDFVDDADAVVLIHPFGQVAAVEEIALLCTHRGIPFIEDASQAIGGAIGRRRVGQLADIAVMSMVSGKNLQTFGGGLMLTDDDGIHRAAQARIGDGNDVPTDRVRETFRSGLGRWFLTTPLGYSAVMHPLTLGIQTLAPEQLDRMFHEERTPYDADRTILRLSDAQGALGCLELAELDRRNERRRIHALRLLDGLRGIAGIALPRFDEGAENTFNAVAIRCADATALAHRLRRRGIDTRSDYMEWFGNQRDFDDEVLYLPNHPGMSEQDVDRVIRAVRTSVA